MTAHEYNDLPQTAQLDPELMEQLQAMLTAYVHYYLGMLAQIAEGTYDAGTAWSDLMALTNHPDYGDMTHLLNEMLDKAMSVNGRTE